MSKEKKQIEKTDLLSAEVYVKNRKKIRKDLLEFKKDRRIALGPYATFYFESFETMLAQVQEMLHIEKGGDEQLKDELLAYNPLIPNGKELTATLMFEIDNPISRAAFLGKAGGKQDARSVWINRMRERRHPNVVAVALANKNARIVWSILSKNEDYRGPETPQAA